MSAKIIIQLHYIYMVAHIVSICQHIVRTTLKQVSSRLPNRNQKEKNVDCFRNLLPKGAKNFLEILDLFSDLTGTGIAGYASRVVVPPTDCCGK